MNVLPYGMRLHQEIEAPEELRDAIRCFWYDRKDFGSAPAEFEVTPDGYAEIIFHFGNLYSVPRSGDLQPLPSPFMMGLLDQPARFYAKDRLEIIGVRCFPWTVFDLLGLPSGKGGLHTFRHPVAGLQPALSERVHAGRAEEAMVLAKQYFLEARSRVAVDSMLNRAGVAMRKANGSLPVSRVAEAAHATVRTLERKFRKSSGHTVKDVSGLMRFEQVRNRLWTDPGSGIAALAYETGYTDQAHLTREFRRYSGITPAAFARRAKTEKLADGSNFVAFVQA